jgi:predicted RNA-binding protein
MNKPYQQSMDIFLLTHACKNRRMLRRVKLVGIYFHDFFSFLKKPQISFTVGRQWEMALFTDLIRHEINSDRQSQYF